jgi:hypothetical protein
VKKEMNKTSKGAIVVLIAAAMIFSTVAVTAVRHEQTPTTTFKSSGSAPGIIGPVVWDNGMDYTGLAASQYDASISFDTFQADDFQFEEATEVADVHWVGGYFNGDPAPFDWCISFYYNNGTNEEPLGYPYNPSFAGPFCFADEELEKDELAPGEYQFSVDLPEILTFDGGEIYWISIWGVGAYPPQSGWAYHETWLLTPALWYSVYFGFTIWTPGVEVLGVDFDCAFQLTGPQDPVAPTAPIIDGPKEGVAGTELCWTFHSEDDNGDDVKYIIDWGDGNTEETDFGPECTPVEVCHTYEKKGNYVIKATAEDETGLVSDESTFDVKIPRSRTVNHPLLRFFERFPNAFPILRQLLGL